MVDTPLPNRLYVGGLAPEVTADEVEARFRSFGHIRGVQLVRDGLGDNNCRGFAFVDWEVSEASLARCMRLYAKTKWRGRQLVIEPARMDYMARLQVCADPILRPAPTVQTSSAPCTTPICDNRWFARAQAEWDVARSLDEEAPDGEDRKSVV